MNQQNLVFYPMQDSAYVLFRNSASENSGTQLKRVVTDRDREGVRSFLNQTHFSSRLDYPSPFDLSTTSGAKFLLLMLLFNAPCVSGIVLDYLSEAEDMWVGCGYNESVLGFKLHIIDKRRLRQSRAKFVLTKFIVQHLTFLRELFLFVKERVMSAVDYQTNVPTTRGLRFEIMTSVVFAQRVCPLRHPYRRLRFAELMTPIITPQFLDSVIIMMYMEMGTVYYRTLLQQVRELYDYTPWPVPGF